MQNIFFNTLSNQFGISKSLKVSSCCCEQQLCYSNLISYSHLSCYAATRLPNHFKPKYKRPEPVVVRFGHYRLN